MPKVKKLVIPHNEKERLRHQKLQQQLDRLASYVPKPFTTKKESKDAKLRRIILYLMFLNKKRVQYKSQGVTSCKGRKFIKGCFSECNARKTTGQDFEILPYSIKQYRRAQIVFLKKSNESSLVKEAKNSSPTLQNLKKFGIETDTYVKKPYVYTDFYKGGKLSKSANVTMNSAQQQNQPANNETEYIPNVEFPQSVAEENNPESSCWNYPHKLCSGESCMHFSSNYLIQQNNSYEDGICNDSLLMPADFSEEGASESSEENNDSVERSPCRYSSDRSKINISLPSISVFSSWYSDSVNKALQCEKDPQKSYLISQVSENGFRETDNIDKHNTSPLICGTFSSNNSYSTNFLSPITSSNECLSDSESFAKSSFDSLSSCALMEDSVNVTSKPKFDSIYYILNKSDSDSYASPMSNHIENQDLTKIEKSYEFDDSYKFNGGVKSDIHVNCVDNSKLCSDYSQLKYQLPFMIKKKNFPTNKDHCVPQYENNYYLPVSEMDELDDMAGCCKTSTCLNMPIKNEIDESPLPEIEKSFSFTNFSQWYPEK